VIEWQQNNFNYLNIIYISLNKRSSIKYWSFCFTQRSKFTYVR